MWNTNWLKLAIFALILNVAIFPIAKYANNFGIASSVSLTIFYFLAATGMCVYLVFKRESFRIRKKVFLVILVTALIMTTMGLLLWQTIMIAPNIGYPLLIVNSAMVLVTVYSGLIMKEDFNFKKVFAVLLIFVGILLVAL